MFKQRFVRPLFLNSYRTYSVVLLVLLLVALVPVVPQWDSAPRVQPALLELANQKPESQVNVIVQKAGPGTGLEELVTDMGGVVTNDLHIINAFSAALPAKEVLKLARASNVRWVSLDAPVEKSGLLEQLDLSKLKNTYIKTIGADKVWSSYQGAGIGVAVVDSGINPQADFYTNMGTSRLTTSVVYNTGYNKTIYDAYGHGSHIAGIIGGNGRQSGGAYVGVAPMANLINVKISDDNGYSTTSNVVAGLQWIYDNRLLYNIRVVNISLNSSEAESYNTSPLCAAAEILWFNGVVVVSSAGNKGSAGLYPPANDPFIITVGATDDRGTADSSDDKVANFSAYGTTADNISKPDLVAPGKNIISTMGNTGMGLALQHPANIVQGVTGYFMMSGTSVAAPQVSGAAALILQANSKLTPDQVKYRLTSTAHQVDSTSKDGAGTLDVYAAVKSTSTAKANVGLIPSQLLATGSNPITSSSANWSSANWSSANWSSANWSSANWSSTYWGP
jgi:serine protease AprX